MEACTPNFRVMEPGDIAVVKELMIQLWTLDPDGDPMTEEHALRVFNRMFKHPDNGRFIVFETGGATVGYALLVYYYSTPYYGMIWNVEELYVLPEYRRKGIVTLFMETLKTEASEDIDTIGLTIQVLPYNVEARELYKRLGFKPEGNGYVWFC